MTLTTHGSAEGHASTQEAPAARGTGTHVTAVLVAHDGEPWLPRALAAVEAQTVPLDVVVGVDTASADRSPALLRDALGDARVVAADRRTGFGDAVRAGLAAVGSVDGDPGRAWVWLLHDDCAPAPDALARLLDAAARSSSVGVVGPKLVDWEHGDRVLEVGLSVSRGGRRDTGVDGRWEHDQGQHDHRHDVLAVGTAGLLVRRDVWDALGGLDPALPLLRDDLDLGWRAHLAGHRVIVEPRAVVADAQASRRGLRPVDAVGRPGRTDRRHALQVAMSRSSLPALPFLTAWLLLAGVARGLAHLVTKRPRRALDELTATALAVLTPWRVVRARWRARGTRRVPRRDVARLLTPRGAWIRHVVDVVGGLAARDATRDETPAPTVIETGPGAEEAEEVVVAPRRVRRALLHPGLAAVVAATVVATAALRDLLGAGVLAGGQLTPPRGDAATWWHAYADTWHGAGAGTGEPASPALALWAGLVALLQPLAGDAAAARALDVVLLGSGPLSALSAYVAAATATRSRWSRAWAALAWALVPSMTGALAAGRLGPALVHVLLPLVAAATARALRPAGSATAAFAAGLGLAVVTALVPVVGLVGLMVALGVLVAGPGPVRARALAVVLVPPALLGPWLAAVADRPLLLADGLGALARTGVAAPPVAVALLHPGGPGGYAVLAGAPLVLAGALALLRGGAAGRAVAVLSGVGLLGLALALAAPHLDLGAGTAPWAGSGTDLLALAVLGAALTATTGLQERLAVHGFGWRQVVLAPVTAAAVLAPLAAGALWVWQPHLQVHRGGETVPAVVADEATGPQRSRALQLTGSLADGVSWRLVGDEPEAPARMLPASDVRRTTAPGQQAVSALLAPVTGGGTVTGGLLDLAVGHVWLTAPADPDLVRLLDATGGLARVGAPAGDAVWRVDRSATSGVDRPSRAVLAAAGTTPATAVPATTATPATTAAPVTTSAPAVRDDATAGRAGVDVRLPATQPGGTLVLAEPRDRAWTARLDGRVLARADAGWRQAWTVPAGGGHLEVTLEDPVRTWWLRGQGVALALCVLLALPLGRRREDTR